MKSLKTFAVATILLSAPSFAMALRTPEPPDRPRAAATVIDAVLDRDRPIDESSREQARLERKRAKAARKQAHEQRKSVREAERDRRKAVRKSGRD